MPWVYYVICQSGDLPVDCGLFRAQSMFDHEAHMHTAYLFCVLTDHIQSSLQALHTHSMYGSMISIGKPPDPCQYIQCIGKVWGMRPLTMNAIHLLQQFSFPSWECKSDWINHAGYGYSPYVVRPKSGVAASSAKHEGSGDTATGLVLESI